MRWILFVVQIYIFVTNNNINRRLTLKILKKTTLILTLGMSLILVTGCTAQKNSTVSKASSSKENTKTSTKSSSSVTEKEKINKEAYDWVDYYNIDYTPPKDIAKIAGYYARPNEPDFPVKIYPDGRYTQFFLQTLPSFGNLRIYFDENNKQITNPFYLKHENYPSLIQGRVVEKNGIDFLVPIATSTGIFLNNKGESTYTFGSMYKEEVSNTLKNKELFHTYEFIKDGLFYLQANDTAENASPKSTGLPDLEKILDRKPLLYATQSQKSVDTLTIDNLNKLYAQTAPYIIDPLEHPLVPLTSDELKKIDLDNDSNNVNKDVKMIYGFKYKEGTDESGNYVSGVATDGNKIYQLNIDTLGIHGRTLKTSL